MRRTIITVAISVCLSLCIVAGAAYATGITEGITFTEPGVKGVFTIDGEVTVDGSNLVMPFSAELELIGNGDPQLRSFVLGENGFGMSIPRVLRPQLADAMSGIGKLIGDAAAVGVGPLQMGFHIDALRVEFTVTFRGPVENPYAYHAEVTTEVAP
jgi:hypothetical protein